MPYYLLSVKYFVQVPKQFIKNWGPYFIYHAFAATVVTYY